MRPVRPPSAMPAAHSTEQQVAELPSAPAIIVATDSAPMARPTPGMLPSSSRSSALAPRPMSEPTVSKRLVSRKAKATTMKPRSAMREKSIFMNVGASEGMARPFEKSGKRLM